MQLCYVAILPKSLHTYNVRTERRNQSDRQTSQQLTLAAHLLMRALMPH